MRLRSQANEEGRWKFLRSFCVFSQKTYFSFEILQTVYNNNNIYGVVPKQHRFGKNNRKTYHFYQNWTVLEYDEVFLNVFNGSLNCLILISNATNIVGPDTFPPSPPQSVLMMFITCTRVSQKVRMEGDCD